MWRVLLVAMVGLVVWASPAMFITSCRGSPQSGGFQIEPHNRYLYAWNPTGRFTYLGDRLAGMGGILPAWERRAIPRSAIPTTVNGVRVGVWPGVATAVCVAQLDDDPEYDVWSVSSVARLDADGMEIRAGEPHAAHSDLP